MTARARRRAQGGRGVLPPLALLGLGAGTALAFALLSPLAEQREQQALETPPDLVSLAYLELSLEQRPDDPVLRRAVVERLLAAGAFAAADAACAPLLRQGDLAAQRLSVEIAFQHWLSLAARERRERAEWLDRTERRLLPLLGAALEPAAAERLAQIAVATGELALGADFLDRLARRDLRQERVQRADRAHLAARQPLAAARLWSALALADEPAPQAAEYARLALERARSADQPEAALQLFRSLRPHFASDPEFLALGLASAGGLDDRVALGIARELRVLRPDDAALAQRVRELEAWTAPPPPPPALPHPLTREQESAQARAHWDLARVLELGAAEPEGRAALQDRISLLEATGRVSEALALLGRALGTPLGGDPALWGQQLALQLAVGQLESSLTTLREMRRRFGLRRADVYREADLLFALGRQREALQALSQWPLEGDTEHARKLASVAWELGDTALVRRALSVLVESPDAQVWDFERLAQLEDAAGDHRAALAAAERGYDRFATAGLLQLCLDAARAGHDEEQTLRLLARAESPGSPLHQEPAYWSLHAQIYQERARQALARGQLSAARQHADEARALLERAALVVPGVPQAYAQLWAVQRRQALGLALESNDARALSVAYEQVAPSLQPRERVAVLSRLGQVEQAADLALDEWRDGGLESTPERDALAADARNLAQALPRQLWLESTARALPQLFSLRLGGGAEYAFSRGLSLRAAADLTQFRRIPSSDPAGAASPLPWSDDDSAIEAAGQITGRLDGSELTLGMAARPDLAVQPFAVFGQQLFTLDRTELRLGLRLNDRALETARLRLFGAEDQLSLSADVGLGERTYLNASVAGQAYWEHDRSYLGSGATIQAGAGYNLPLGAELGNANFRASAYFAPRLPEDRSGGFLPDSTTWVGLGTSLVRGRLDVPPVLGRELNFSSDATLGWLLPQQQLGWSGRLGLGISLFGGDLFSLSAAASNVLGTAPGFAAYELSAEYRVSEWK